MDERKSRKKIVNLVICFKMIELCIVCKANQATVIQCAVNHKFNQV